MESLVRDAACWPDRCPLQPQKEEAQCRDTDHRGTSQASADRNGRGGGSWAQDEINNVPAAVHEQDPWRTAVLDAKRLEETGGILAHDAAGGGSSRLITF